MRPATILVLAVSLALVAGLYVAFQPAAGPGSADAAHAHARTPSPAETTDNTKQDGSSALAAAAQTQSSVPLPYRVAISKSQTGVAASVLKARQGDLISVVFVSDQAGTVEIHGYNRSVAVAPGVEATLTIQADQSGRFPVHLHSPQGAHIEVTALEVQPR